MNGTLTFGVLCSHATCPEVPRTVAGAGYNDTIRAHRARHFHPFSMTLDDIKQAIPHRDPFLWLDEVVEISATKIVARKHLSPDLDLFRGHYPHFPILPGVIQCEAAFQAAAVLISRILPAGSHLAPVVTRLNNVQFRSMVRPNQTIVMDVELTDRLQNTFYLKGKVTSNGQVCCRLEFACTATEITPE